MAIGLLATITVQEGKNAEFEEVFLDLTEQVRANEPGTLFYVLHRCRSNPQEYKVMEQYDGPEALEAHGKTEYFQAASAKLGELVVGAPEIEIMETVAR
jgi:quinol monooxygenase YgiN